MESRLSDNALIAEPLPPISVAKIRSVTSIQGQHAEVWSRS